MSTMTMIGVLDTEAIQHEDLDGQGTNPVHMARPAGTPLRNDGVFRYWLAREERYQMSWDGTGWHVTCNTWRGGHVYRLADADAQLVTTLPVAGATVELERGKVYEIHETKPGQWGLYTA